jgi:hypothetical protein
VGLGVWSLQFSKTPTRQRVGGLFDRKKPVKMERQERTQHPCGFQGILSNMINMIKK